MDFQKIPESKTLNWKVSDKYVQIDVVQSKLLLNETSSIIWKKIDGHTSVGEIIEKLYEEYKENNPKSHIEEIVQEALQEFLNNDLIILKDKDDLNGWLLYE